MLRESDICGICGKRFRVGQTLNITLLGDRTQEGERDHIYVHIKCAIPYHEKEKKRKKTWRDWQRRFPGSITWRAQ